ncbi:NAD(P)/FAD-dependent oxidoreductase [Pedobacter nyackensis]|uniref:NAD(P)/FAD-dependent oxidoreductase n=1 Tax=Pedobacter nyackensis TaxID=475255 RepID=UPI002931CA5C|nr:NAD(P)/FAD-dependent oxidoreductase [Pedobacter nyackensis]
MTTKTNQSNNIIIVGGGLAGLTCALHLLKEGFEVTLIEKNEYPHHKVCGEYISNEVLPYLQWLDADPQQLLPVTINRLSVSALNGKVIGCDLPLGGFGLSRFALDSFLYEKTIRRGCNVIKDRVTDIIFKNNDFELTTSKTGTLKADLVIGAFGKRSALDQKLSRGFMHKKSPWLAVKAHYSGIIPSDLVQLHNFAGGYCGVSTIENKQINICYLADYESFKAYRNLEDFQKKVLYKNPQLQKIFEESTMLFDQPLTISQISFAKKELVYNHVLMIGDTAGLIHPLCGNGMAMAIHSAKICAELSIQYLNSSLISRTALENQYTNIWNANFKNRLMIGRFLSGIIKEDKLFKPMQHLLAHFPSSLSLIVKMTHGKPIICE